MEKLPETDFDRLKQKMENEGFVYLRVENLYGDTFSAETKKFESEHIQTEEDILNKYKNSAEEVKLIPVPRTKIENSQFYVFVK